VKDGPLDPRIDRLIASLYGEATEAEERETERLLAEDPELRAEWEELRAARALLKDWEVEEAPPNFVMVAGETPTAAARAAGPLGRWRARLARLAPAPAWGLAAAAVLLGALALADVRVRRIESGIAFGFGDAATRSATPVETAGRSEETVAQAAPAQVSPATILPASDAGSPTTGGATPAQSPYFTRDEFKAYSDGMARTMVALLNDYSSRRDKEVSRALVSLYQELNQKQTVAYDELRDRIDAVGVGLLMEQTKTDAQLDNLLGQGREGSLNTRNPSPIDTTEER
jgi:hypothetical protein